LGWEGLAGLEHNRGEKAALPSSAADVRLLRDCSTTGRDSSSRGEFNNGPTDEEALRDRVEKLERLVGNLTFSVCPEETAEHQAVGMSRCCSI